MRLLLILAGCVVSVSALAAAPAHDKTPGKHAASARTLTASQIIDRNVAARGGLQAWRAVQTLTLSGKMEAGGKENPELPFVLKMKRQHKSRLELQFQEQTAIQVYDGKQGWKLRPFVGRDDVEPFTPDESRAAGQWQELDGPLIDYAKKGIKVRMQGKDAVEGHPAYKLLLTMRDGSHRHVWVDAGSFLEVKVDGEPRRMDGRMRNVVVYYRDYRKENDLTMPHVLETVVEGGSIAHKMKIEDVAVNQPMDDVLFGKPQGTLVRSSYQ